MVEMHSHIMENTVDRTIAERLKLLRTQAGYSLDTLATRSGVSRAMISRIERAEASPTAALLARLANALGESLSSFFAATAYEPSPMARHAEQPLWRDPDSGYLRRSVSPPGLGSPVDIVEVEFPPEGRVVLPPQPHLHSMTQHIWLLSGVLVMTAGDDIWQMAAGDCLFMPIGVETVFANPSPDPARYAVIIHRGA